jgi:hypothetical protein
MEAAKLAKVNPPHCGLYLTTRSNKSFHRIKKYDVDLVGKYEITDFGFLRSSCLSIPPEALLLRG